MKQGNYQDGLDAIMQAIAYFDEIDVQLHRLSVGPMLAQAYIGLGKYAEAEAELRWMVYLADGARDVTVMTDVQLLLGWLLLRKGEVVEARQRLRAATAERVRRQWTRVAAVMLLAGSYPQGHRGPVRLRAWATKELRRQELPTEVWEGKAPAPPAPWAFEVWLVRSV